MNVSFNDWSASFHESLLSPQPIFGIYDIYYANVIQGRVTSHSSV